MKDRTLIALIVVLICLTLCSAAVVDWEIFKTKAELYKACLATVEKFAPSTNLDVERLRLSSLPECSFN